MAKASRDVGGGPCARAAAFCEETSRFQRGRFRGRGNDPGRGRHRQLTCRCWGGLPTVLQARFSVCSSTTFSLEREVTGWPVDAVVAVDAQTRRPRLGHAADGVPTAATGGSVIGLARMRGSLSMTAGWGGAGEAARQKAAAAGAEASGAELQAAPHGRWRPSTFVDELQPASRRVTVSPNWRASP